MVESLNSYKMHHFFMLNIKVMRINAKREVNKNFVGDKKKQTQEWIRNICCSSVEAHLFGSMYSYTLYWRTSQTIGDRNFSNQRFNVKWLNAHQIIIINIKITPNIQSDHTIPPSTLYVWLKMPLFSASVLYFIFMCERRIFFSQFFVIILIVVVHIFICEAKNVPRKKKMFVH